LSHEFLFFLTWVLYSSAYLDLRPQAHPELELEDENLTDISNPTDISTILAALAPYPDDTMDQSTILTEIIATTWYQQLSDERFDNAPLQKLKLSKLRHFYEKRDENVVNLLSTRHYVHVDEEFRVPLGTGQVIMDTDESMIDYHLTVANQIGFSALLPNALSDHRFSFEMDLKNPCFSFKGKHAMLGFDPAGSMLYIGRCQNEDVFLAMAPNEFLRGHTRPSPPGHSSASPLMSKRHYRQVVMMIVHFLARVPERAFHNVNSVYELELDSLTPDFESIMGTLYVFHSHPSIHSVATFLSTFISFPPNLHGVDMARHLSTRPVIPTYAPPPIRRPIAHRSPTYSPSTFLYTNVLCLSIIFPTAFS
jgi:hypothetical protein